MPHTVSRLGATKYLYIVLNLVSSFVRDGMMMMMVYYCLSKRTPLLTTHTFTPVESELNTLSAALAASQPLLAGTDP
jgi:hypothetical protein